MTKIDFCQGLNPYKIYDWHSSTQIIEPQISDKSYLIPSYNSTPKLELCYHNPATKSTGNTSDCKILEQGVDDLNWVVWTPIVISSYIRGNREML